jgi:hypothetical protein
MRQTRFLTLAVVAMLLMPIAGYSGQAKAANGVARFEVTSLRSVRPILVKTVADLEKKDVAAAKADMENYDSAWNGVEVYVNTRSAEMYNDIEHNWQTKVTEAVNKPNADATAILPDAKAMLAKYDEMLAMSQRPRPSILSLTMWRGCGWSAHTCARSALR